ncbi:4-(cytidine 5'-diphospho)-2-C-methyl-D-erythritol kinase [Uliginosibacterium aquaticum]|uniref:4-diphosphocytidyl-2-C-methyl-D-erythritol kinase n=1 Tax=Uliginosibacterium aquaticum TaxID=2731212 RepID=A0ABX2IQ57_9RHOO|nr:4-(cytidine 5'-diphospho)-2-C-methyl-D-erythritol kinase [Uliginosibacterium aquaticum]NSL56280.1 4-(cytidine 5'-diphospho)-2-C-methyl-D-erythritol kinase [Uliginosibacterium aquaticum]
MVHLDGFLYCPAPAKINLFLHVTGRRADGYHLLQTAFRMLDHGDTLGFRVREDGAIRRLSEVPGVAEDSDLVVRAARLLQARTGCLQGAEICIDKQLPMGGGLGGGSSDAATTLLALNHLWQLGCSRAELQAWGLELGADVPFFLFGQTAWAEGVGEALQPLELPPAWYVVIEPPVAVPTVEIFRAKELTRDSSILIMPGFAAEQTQAFLEQQGRNDMQAVACRLYPEVQQALDALTPFGTARMSGSGACVFLSCQREAEAKKVVEAVQDKWRVWCAPSLDKHPLHAWARD